MQINLFYNLCYVCYVAKPSLENISQQKTYVKKSTPNLKHSRNSQQKENSRIIITSNLANPKKIGFKYEYPAKHNRKPLELTKSL